MASRQPGSPNNSSGHRDFKKIFETSPERQILIDADAPRFTMLAASDSYLDLMMMPRRDIVGRGVFEVFPDDPTREQHRLRQALEVVVEDGSRQSLAAYRFDLADPDTPDEVFERYWSPALIPVFDDDGQVDTIVLRVEEATDFVLRERYLYARHNTEPADQLPELEGHRTILVVEPDQSWQAMLSSAFAAHWNVVTAPGADAALALMEHVRPDVLITSLELPDRDGVEFITEIKQTRTVSLIARVDEHDGKRYRQAFEAGADDVIAGPASRREFMARVQTQFAEAALRETAYELVHRQYRQLLMEAPIGIALLEGPEHIFTLSNPAYDDIVGNRPLIGQPLRQAFPEENLEPLIDRLERVYETGEPFSAQELPAETRPTEAIDDNKQPYLTFAYLPHRNPRGEIKGVAVFVYDVTEQVEMRRAVERESERKDLFLAMLGHELRNPLSPIAHASELLQLKADDLDTDTIDWITGTIDRQVNQLEHHVNELLDIARIQQQRIEINRDPVALPQLVTSAVEASRAAIDSRDQQLSVSRPDHPVTVDVDAARITQVVTNLLTNASKNTDSGGRIELDVQLDDQSNPAQLVIRVRDEGRGIEPELLTDIFQPFTQADVTIDRAHGGLGLGLALVRGIVEMHDGEVTAHSEGPGTGSEFLVRIPVDITPIDQQQHSLLHQQQPGGCPGADCG